MVDWPHAQHTRLRTTNGRERKRRTCVAAIFPSHAIALGMGTFDVITLRNVIIYLDIDTKRQVVAKLLPRLLSDGYFIVGHSESLSGLTDQLVAVRPTIYRKG